MVVKQAIHKQEKNGGIMKILLAEDDESISKIAKMTLELIGKHQVTQAFDGEQAVNLALKNSFDLILLDGMMPKLNGLAVCQKLKVNEKIETPIIFLSAKSQESDIREAIKTGAIGYIQKPFEPAKICSQIDKILKDYNERVA